VLDGDPALSNGKGHSSPPLFGPCLLWSNGHPYQVLLSSCTKGCPTILNTLLITPLASGKPSSQRLYPHLPRLSPSLFRHRPVLRLTFSLIISLSLLFPFTFPLSASILLSPFPTSPSTVLKLQTHPADSTCITNPSHLRLSSSPRTASTL